MLILTETMDMIALLGMDTENALPQMLPNPGPDVVPLFPLFPSSFTSPTMDEKTNGQPPISNGEENESDIDSIDFSELASSLVKTMKSSSNKVAVSSPKFPLNGDTGLEASNEDFKIEADDKLESNYKTKTRANEKKQPDHLSLFGPLNPLNPFNPFNPLKQQRPVGPFDLGMACRGITGRHEGFGTINKGKGKMVKRPAFPFPIFSRNPFMPRPPFGGFGGEDLVVGILLMVDLLGL